MDRQQESQDLRALIEKYLDGKATGKELEKLVNYYESFQETEEWSKELGSEELLKNKMLTAILESIDRKSRITKVKPFYKKQVFKYAVAASIVILVSLNLILFKGGVLQTGPLTSDTHAITAGTNKATLTLGDGTLVNLESGKAYKSAYVNSNGKEIIYNANENKPASMVYNYLTIPRGGQFFLKLSDGTQVWLNSESQLKYPVNFISGQSRQVELIYGEAYFDVSPSENHNGARFNVVSGSQNINVLGTAFNVRSYNTEKEIVTTLVEGKVEIEHNNTSLHLQPKQKSILDKEKNLIAIQDTDLSVEVSWVNGLYTFDDASLVEIMETLSRWYDFEFVFKNTELRDYAFTGVLERSEQIQNVLKKLEAAGGIHFKINNRIIMIE